MELSLVARQKRCEDLFTTEIVWHKASEDPPKKSGFYLVAYPGYPNFSVATIPYSVRHGKFNCTDYSHAGYAMDVLFWAEIPHFSQAIAPAPERMDENGSQ